MVIIGEAVKSIPQEVLNQEPLIPWSEIAAMRNRVVHRYFDTAHAVVVGVARQDIAPLLAAVERLLADPTVA